MKRSILIALGTGLLVLLLCSLPYDPADDYGNSTVSMVVDSLKPTSTGTFTDTLGDSIQFSFIRTYSQHIDSFVVNFNDGLPVRFATSTYIADTIQCKHTFGSVGHKVVKLTVYYNNRTTRSIDSLAIIDIVNRKPVFMGIKPDSVFTLKDSSSVTIPIKVKKWSTDSLVFRIISSTLPESSTVALVGDTSLVVNAPKNTSGTFKVVLQVADHIDSVRTTFNLTVTDKTAPFAPVFTCPALFTTTTPTWTWKTGGNGGAGIYRFNVDNGNTDSSIYAEKAATSFQPPMSMTEGVHTLFIKERDSSGNWSPVSSWAITIDVTGPPAPVVSGTTPTNNRKPTWTWIGSNAAAPHFKYQLDSMNFSPTDTSFTLSTSFTPATELSEGKHTLYVRELDNAGNWSSPGSFTITVDLTGPQSPTVTGTTPTTNSRPVWTWTSNGGGGIGDFRCALDTTSFDSAFATSAHMFTAPKELAEGKHTLNVQERDSAGNWSLSGSFSVLIDVTAPNPPIVTVVAVTNSKTPTWTWTSGGGGNGTFRYKLDSDDLSNNATENTSHSFTPPTYLTEGLHTFYIQERDSTGNWSVQVAKETMVDLTPPEKPTISGLSLTNSTKPIWSWTSASIGTFRLKIDSKDMATGATTLDTTAYTSEAALTEGNHTLYVQVSDSAGNWSPLDSFITVIDLTPPAAPVVIGTAVTNNTKPTWSWSSSGGNGQYRYKLDSADLKKGATVTTLTSYTPETNLTEGEHTLHVQESDAAGNWSLSGSFRIKIDTTAAGAPSVSGVSPTNNPKPVWSWKSGGGAKSYRYKLDDTSFTTGTTPTTDSTFTPATALTEGNHILYVEENDGSGNWSSRGLFVIQVDLTPPLPPVISGLTPTNNAKPVWSWTMGAGGNGTFRYKFNNSDLSTGATTTTDTTFTPETELADKSHTLYLQERDAAGNWSTVVSFVIVIDLTPPNAPKVDGVTPTNNLRPEWSWASGGGGGNGHFRYSLDSPFSSGVIGMSIPGDKTSVINPIDIIIPPIRFLWTTATQFKPASNLAAGSHTLYVQEQDAAGNISASGSKTIVIDTTAGSAPVISGTTPTNDNTPTWSWTSGGGKGYYSYRLDDSNIDGAPSYTSLTSYTPSSPLSDGMHVLYVKEQDAAGNWSTVGYLGITVDTQKPGSPVFSTTSPRLVSSKTVTWSWQTGGGGNGKYSYRLDNGSWSAEIATTSYTATNLSEGNHTLSVMERDAAGNWSTTSSNVAYVLLAPTNLTKTFTVNPALPGYGTLTLKWTDNSTVENGYVVYISGKADFSGVTPITLPPNATSYSWLLPTGYCSVFYFGVAASQDINNDGGPLDLTPMVVAPPTQDCIME